MPSRSCGGRDGKLKVGYLAQQVTHNGGFARARWCRKDDEFALGHYFSP